MPTAISTHRQPSGTITIGIPLKLATVDLAKFATVDALAKGVVRELQRLEVPATVMDGSGNIVGVRGSAVPFLIVGSSSSETTLSAQLARRRRRTRRQRGRASSDVSAGALRPRVRSRHPRRHLRMAHDANPRPHPLRARTRASIVVSGIGGNRRIVGVGVSRSDAAGLACRRRCHRGIQGERSRVRERAGGIGDENGPVARARRYPKNHVLRGRGYPNGCYITAQAFGPRLTHRLQVSTWIWNRSR